MAKLLGIDFGDTRIGLATGNTVLGIGHPHSVLDAGPCSIEEIVKFVKEENIEKIILGLPRSLNGEEGPQAESVREFATRLADASGLEIIFQDERYSSRQAESLLVGMGKSRDARKAASDAHQAAIILQTYLDSLEGND